MFFSVMPVVSIGLFAIGLALLYIALDLWHRHIQSVRHRVVDISIGVIIAAVGAASLLAAVMIFLGALGVFPPRLYADAALYYLYLLLVGVLTTLVACVFVLTMIAVWPLYASHRYIHRRARNAKRFAKRHARSGSMA